MIRESGDSHSTFTLRVGSVSIHFRSDPIESILRTTDLDAVVSSDDSLLSMAGGVSASIAALAGPSVQQEVTGLIPVPVGSLAVTSGGDLPVKYIIHAVTVDRANEILATPRTINQLLRGILSRCEGLRITRIAITELAWALGPSGPWAPLRLVARALREHFLNPTVLQTVVLAFPKTSAELVRSELNYPRGNWAAVLRSYQSPDEIPTEPDTTDVVPTRGTVARIAGDPRSRPLMAERYALLEEIGRGGMAVVYLSWDIVMRRVVAIKVPRPDVADPELLRREATAALELSHEGIVRLYHFEPPRDTSEGFLVMEYVSWPSGEKWVVAAGGALPVRPIIDVGVRLCEALAYAHSRSVLHLDVKPSNIFVDPAGETAKLGDFGLACVASSSGQALKIRPTGTPAYMAPEQVNPGAKVSMATDAYQLAATLWDLRTGSPPQRGRETLDLARDHLLSILNKALAPDPASRPSIADLREMLAAAR